MEYFTIPYRQLIAMPSLASGYMGAVEMAQSPSIVRQARYHRSRN